MGTRRHGRPPSRNRPAQLTADSAPPPGRGQLGQKRYFLVPEFLSSPNQSVHPDCSCRLRTRKREISSLLSLYEALTRNLHCCCLGCKPAPCSPHLSRPTALGGFRPALTSAGKQRVGGCPESPPQALLPPSAQAAPLGPAEALRRWPGCEGDSGAAPHAEEGEIT